MPSVDRIPHRTVRERRGRGSIGNNFLPYVDAIKDVDLGAFNFTTTGIVACGMVDMLEISEPAVPATDTLRLYVEDIHGFSFLKYLDSGGMKRELVRDSLILVKNIRGSTIAANRIVYATGNENEIPTIDTAKADSTSTLPAIGVTIAAIADGAYGRVMQVGLLENVNTATLAVGDVLYVSDSVAGVPTTTPPVTPSLTQEIGTVLVSDASVGAIQIVARGLTGDEHGTAQNSFLIGDGTTGSKTLTFNAASDASIVWNETSINLGAAATFGDGGTTNFVLVSATGDLSFAGSAGFYPRFLTQSAEPAAGTGATQCDTSELLVWKDSDDSKVYLCFNDGGTIKKVELT